MGIRQSDDLILNRLRKQLVKEVSDRPMPVCALLHAQPNRSACLLRPEEDLFHLPGLGNRPSVFFSPVLPQTLHNTQVRYMIGAQGCTSILPPLRKQVTLFEGQQNIHPGELWIGIELPDDWEAQTQLELFFDWPGIAPERKQQLCGLLPLIKWTQNNKILTVNKHVFTPDTAVVSADPEALDEESMLLYQVEQRAIHTFQEHFIGIKGLVLDKGLPEAFRPFSLSDDVEKEDLEKMIWVKLSFPAGILPDELQRVVVQTNCFPALNRRLDKSRDFTPDGIQKISIRPISNAVNGKPSLAESGVRFLAMQRVFTQKFDYRMVSTTAFSQSLPGHYALQCGSVEADDVRDLYLRVAELSQTIQEKTAIMTLLDQHQLNQALQHFDNGAALLLGNLQQIPASSLDPGYYLHIRLTNPNDVVYVRFWVTQGQSAINAGQYGDRLVSERHGTIEGDAACWIM